jgi:hypothetical protein
MQSRIRNALFFCAIGCAHAVRANHGPGASGGGAATISGETLKENHFELSVREDGSQCDHFTAAAAGPRAARGGDFDALDHGFIHTFDLAYGITDDLQFGGSIGYFEGNDFVSAERADDGAVSSSRTNPNGLTDLSLAFKYRVLQGKPGNLSLIAGAILPTGRSSAHLANSEPLSPTDQPGTGRYGTPLGLGYSRFLTPHLTIDASALYTLRFEKDAFKVGDRFDTGVALAYRLTDSIKTFPQYSIFTELNNVYLAKDHDHGQNDPNSGSDTLYLTPGGRVRFTPNMAITVAPSIPIYEHLNGDQGRVLFKLAVTFSLSF